MKKKVSEREIKSEDGYHYREVICPLCDHKFMDETHKQPYDIVGDERKFYLSSCPGCGEELLVPNGELEAVLLSDVPESKRKTHIYLT